MNLLDLAQGVIEIAGDTASSAGDHERVHSHSDEACGSASIRVRESRPVASRKGILTLAPEYRFPPSTLDALFLATESSSAELAATWFKDVYRIQGIEMARRNSARRSDDTNGTSIRRNQLLR